MRERLLRRLFPLVASAGLIVVGMLTTTWGPSLIDRSQWALPYDYWGTLVAATRLAHGHLGGIYAPPTGLVSLPGTAVILVPVAVVASLLGLSLQLPGPANLHPAVWLVAGPYQIALCCIALFAADGLAEHLGVAWWKRGLLAVAEATALWSPSARWGHPEDAVATGLLLYAVLALAKGRLAAAGWLAGAAVCVQPLVLLALPVLIGVMPLRRVTGFLLRAALPAAVLLAAVGIANWNVMYSAVTSQPNSPTINHPTAWTALAPHLANGNVAAGPFRLAAIAAACCLALVIHRRLAGRLPAVGHWPLDVLNEVLWWMALALALRSFFEPVMVSYYPWPPLAVALIPAATGGWARLVVASLVAGGITAEGQGTWHNVWTWWVPLVAGLLLLLFVARRDWRLRAARAPAVESSAELGRGVV